jgi:hypothetical protein
MRYYRPRCRDRRLGGADRESTNGNSSNSCGSGGGGAGGGAATAPQLSECSLNNAGDAGIAATTSDAGRTVSPANTAPTLTLLYASGRQRAVAQVGC